MPDLYGRASTSKAERKRLNTWRMLPWRLWSFFVQRNLLRSHNLLLTAAPERRLILVDYDAVPHSKLYQFFYYMVRLLLFLPRSGFDPGDGSRWACAKGVSSSRTA